MWDLSKHLEDLGFAKDICLMTHNLNDMQSNVDDLVKLAKVVGLAINIENTHRMRIKNVIENDFVTQLYYDYNFLKRSFCSCYRNIIASYLISI